MSFSHYALKPWWRIRAKAVVSSISGRELRHTQVQAHWLAWLQHQSPSVVIALYAPLPTEVPLLQTTLAYLPATQVLLSRFSGRGEATPNESFAKPQVDGLGGEFNASHPLPSGEGRVRDSHFSALFGRPSPAAPAATSPEGRGEDALLVEDGVMQRSPNVLSWHAYASITKWEQPFGVTHPYRQPVASTPVWQGALPDACVIPCPLLDDRGIRLGHGGGWYDRQLAYWQAHHRQLPLCVGVGLAAQRVRRLPAQPHDHPLHTWLDDTGWHTLPTGQLANKKALAT